jgi:hypothetical protein
MGTLLVVREAAGFLSGAFGYEGPAGARAFSDMSKLAKQVRQGEADVELLKATVKVAGVLLHLPVGQAVKTAEGIAALAEGETTNPGVLIAGPGPKRR